MTPLRRSWALLLLLAPPQFADAGNPKGTLNEITQRSDLIFVGTVERQESRFERKFIVTDVVFTQIRLIHAGPKSKQASASTITLNYTGGTVGDTSMGVSGMPRFRTGARYLVFMMDDGESYFNPLVGGYQGKYEVVRDEASGEEYPLVTSGKGILRSSGGDLRQTRKRIDAVWSGAPVWSAVAVQPQVTIAPPTASDPLSRAEKFTLPADDDQVLMTLGEFIQKIKGEYLVTPPSRRVFPSEGRGKLYRTVNGKLEITDLMAPGVPGSSSQLPGQEERTIPAGSVNAGTTSAPPSGTSTLGQTLEYCGYQSLSLVMEQVPSSWWSYGIHTDCMWTWNQFMDVYRYKASDGRYGSLNNENEFAGWLTDDELHSTYLKHWGTAVGMTWWWGAGSPLCGLIMESDVIYNAAYSWTSEPLSFIGNASVIGLRSTTIHELGHTWGAMNGVEETYDYDVPTVMHGEYSNIVEDGWGIHAADAQMFRADYKDQTSPTYVRDVGVESYYASGGLNPARTDTTFYFPEQSITFHGVTVENMTKFAISNVRVRFYLSTDRQITTSDRLIGSYWSWSSLSPEVYSVDNYTSVIPVSTPPGTYYVGVRVTIDGDGADDYPYNNATSFTDPITIRPPVTVSGHVLETGTGIALSNVTMEGLPGNPKSNTLGEYSVIVPPHWSGTVRPSVATHTFIPASITYTNLTSSQEGNYAGTLSTIPVSGSVLVSGGAGIEGVTLTGLPSPPVTAANGLFVRMVPYGWSGVVRPDKPAYRFYPDSVVLTNVTALQSLAFRGEKVQFGIRGAVVIPPRSGVAGVVMQGLPGDPYTDGNGNYATLVDSGWSGTVRPTLSGYLFTPESTAYQYLTTDQRTSYSAQRRPIVISGTVQKGGGAGIDSVLMGGLPFVCYTDSAGSYRAVVTFAWNGTVRPQKSGYTFTPGATIYPKLAQDTVTSYIGNGPPVAVHLMLGTYPAGIPIRVDDSLQATPVSLQMQEGDTVAISADSLISFGFGTRYRWYFWTDGRQRSHTVVLKKDTALVALFATDLQVSVSPSPAEGGTTSPSGDRWRSKSSIDTILAFPQPGFTFLRWEGDIADSANPAIFTVDRPKTITATFSRLNSVGGREGVVTEYSLRQNFPNPFNPSATIEYAIPVRCHVTLEVFDLLGHRIALLVDETEEAGEKKVRFEGASLSSGMYIYRLRAGEYMAVKKLLLVR